MLAIKLKRIGKKGQATFRVVVMEKRSKMAGKYAEDLGYFNPHNNQYSVKKDRAEYWLKSGAQPTDSVYNLLVKSWVIKGKKKPVHGVSEKPQEEIKAEETKIEAAAPVSAETVEKEKTESTEINEPEALSAEKPEN